MFEHDRASQHTNNGDSDGERGGDGWGLLDTATTTGNTLATQLEQLLDHVQTGIDTLNTTPGDTTPFNGSSGSRGGQRGHIARELSLTAARLNHLAQRLHVATVKIAQHENVHLHDRIPTMSHWLALHHGIARRDANRLLRATTTIERFEQIATAYNNGTITLGHLDAISKIIPTRYTHQQTLDAIEAIRNVEQLLIDTATHTSINRFEQFCDNVRDRLDQDGPSDPNTEPSHITLSKTFNGRWHLHGNLTPDDGALLATILHDLINRQTHTTTNETNETDSGSDNDSGTATGPAEPDSETDETTGANAPTDASPPTEPEPAEPGPGPGEPEPAEPVPPGPTEPEPAEPEPAEPAEPERGPTMAQRRANALRDALITAAGATKPGRVGTYLHIDLDKLNRVHEGLTALFTQRHGQPDISGPTHTETNLDITDQTLWALLANADITPTFTRNGTPLSYGHTRRLAPDILRRVLAHRDRGCRFPGCERPTIGSDLHHLTHHSNGGTTDPDNLTHLCRYHHTRHHTGHATITGNPNQPLQATRPDNTTITNAPRHKQPTQP